MSKFIRVTEIIKVNNDRYEEILYINPMYIISFLRYESERRTKINIINGELVVSLLYIKETPEEILQLIKEA